jgi:hypothetical protein
MFLVPAFLILVIVLSGGALVFLVVREMARRK